MIIIINNKKYLSSEMDVRFSSYFRNKIITIDNYTFNGNIVDAPGWNTWKCCDLKRAIRAISMAFPDASLHLGMRNELYVRKLQKMKKIIRMLGDKPFGKPKTLWEYHVNSHGVILPRDYHHLHLLEKCGFEILPYPMFMGQYDENYTEVLVGLKMNDNGLPIINL